MEADDVGAGPGKVRDDAVDRLDHQVHVDGRPGERPDRLAHHRADGQVRHVMVVHHVEVNEVRAGRNHSRHFFAQPREVGRQDAGRDAVACGHPRIVRLARCCQLASAQNRVQCEPWRTKYDITVTGARRRSSPNSPTPDDGRYVFAYTITITNTGVGRGAAHQPPLDHHRRRTARCRRCAASAWSASSRCCARRRASSTPAARRSPHRWHHARQLPDGGRGRHAASTRRSPSSRSACRACCTSGRQRLTSSTLCLTFTPTLSRNAEREHSVATPEITVPAD